MKQDRNSVTTRQSKKNYIIVDIHATITVYFLREKLLNVYIKNVVQHCECSTSELLYNKQVRVHIIKYD